MAEKHQVDKSIDELVDIRDVKLDSSLGQAERIQSFLQQIKNPYCFRVGDVVVNLMFFCHDLTALQSLFPSFGQLF